MTIATLSFITLALFMLHEFDEIIWIRPWIEKHQHDPRYQREIFIAGHAHYPSTEAIAFIIAEEYLLASLGLLLAIGYQLPELALAFVLGHTLHLLGHIAEVLRFRRWVPGGLTVVLTFPPLLALLAHYLTAQRISWPLLFLLTPLVLAALLLNLALLHRCAPAIHRWLHRVKD